MAEGPALSLSTTTTEGPAPSSSASHSVYLYAGAVTLAHARVHSEFSPGNALRHRDIPKRYILTFLKRDGHIHTYIHTYAPSENRSHIQNLALRSAIISQQILWPYSHTVTVYRIMMAIILY